MGIGTGGTRWVGRDGGREYRKRKLELGKNEGEVVVET